MDPIRVVIVASYASTRAGLAVMLGDDPTIAVLAEVSGSLELDRLLSSLRPDAVLADDSPLDRERLLTLLASADIPVTLLHDACTSPIPPAVGRAVVSKELSGLAIRAALQAVAAGLVVGDAAHMDSSAAAGEVDPPVEGPLTAREREVLQLLALGLPNKIIATRLAISLHTVKFHVASILSKLGAESRTEAVAIGARTGLITL